MAFVCPCKKCGANVTHSDGQMDGRCYICRPLTEEEKERSCDCFTPKAMCCAKCVERELKERERLKAENMRLREELARVTRSRDAKAKDIAQLLKELKTK